MRIELVSGAKGGFLPSTPNLVLTFDTENEEGIESDIVSVNCQEHSNGKYEKFISVSEAAKGNHLSLKMSMNEIISKLKQLPTDPSGEDIYRLYEI